MINVQARVSCYIMYQSIVVGVVSYLMMDSGKRAKNMDMVLKCIEIIGKRWKANIKENSLKGLETGREPYFRKMGTHIRDSGEME